MSPRSATVALVAALVLVGCSGDDDTSATSTSGPPPTTVAPTTVLPTVPATTAPPTTVDPYGDWCALAERADAMRDRADAIDYTDPSQVESYFDEYVPMLEQARRLAPDEIADAVATTADIGAQFSAAVVAVDYDMFIADLSFLDDVQDARDEAGDIIDLFNEEHCDIPRDPDDNSSSDDDFSFGDGTLRDQFVGRLVDQGFTLDEAECVYDHVDFSDLDSLNDNATMTAVFEACDISLQRLGEINNSISGTDMWADLRVVLDDAGVPADQIDCVVDDLGARGATDVASELVFRALVSCGVNVTTMNGGEVPPVDDVEAAAGDLLIEFGVEPDVVACVTTRLDLSDLESAFDPEPLAAALDDCLSEG